MPRRRRRKLWRALWILAGLFLLAAACAGWLGYHAITARRMLLAAKANVAALRADLLAGNTAAARLALAATGQEAAAAERDTHDPVWFVASLLPPVRTVRGLASAADSLARNVLPEVVSVGTSVNPNRLRTGPHTIDLAPIQAAAAPLGLAARATAEVTGQVRDLPAGWFRQLASARGSVLAELTSLAGSLSDAASFARIGPGLLGADGPRRYFVGVQNNAESRGSGGLLGAYAVLLADHGSLRIVARGSNAALLNPLRPAVAMSADFNAAYGQFDPTGFWLASNFSPDFADTGRIWAALYQEQFHQRISGAIAIDPATLADVLAATGPVNVPAAGGPVSAANIVAVTEQQAYARYPSLSQQGQRQVLLEDVANSVIDKVLSGAGSASALVTELGDAAGAGHLQIFATQGEAEAVLAGTPLGGVIPDDRRPFAALAVDNAGGDPLDYYLYRSLRYRAPSCAGPDRLATITVTLRNAAPLTGLPAYVRSRPDLGASVIEQVPRDLLLVYVYASTGAELTSATLNGQPTELSPLAERGHPMFGTELTVDPGRSDVLVLHLLEPVWPGKPQTKPQGLVHPQRTELDAPACR